MILRTIFGAAALTALHTGVAAGIAVALGGENAAVTGFTSFAVGIPSLLAGAFAADMYYHHMDDGEAKQKRTTVFGLLGYATGSTIGFALKHS